MADFSPEKLIAWAKAHKEIVIPAVVIGGGLGAYVLLKGGGLSSAGTSSGTTPPQAGDPTTGGGGGGGTGDGMNTTPGFPSTSSNDSAIAQLLNQFQAFQGQISDALAGITGQTNQALQSQADQTNSALSRLQQQYAQQTGMGDNGLGQLLMQLPPVQQQIKNYSQSAITMPHFAASPYQIKTVIDTTTKGSVSVANSVQSVLNSLRSSYSAPQRISTPTPGFNPLDYLRRLTPITPAPSRNISLPISLPRPTPVVTPVKNIIGKINTQYGRGH